MNAYDEKLQKAFEKGQVPDGESIDVKAYQEVFKALKTKPGFELSHSFAEKVMAAVVSRQRESQSRDYFWFAAGIFVLMISAVATVMVTGFRLNFGFLNVMSDYKGLLAFAVVFVAFLHWVDKKIVRRGPAHF